MSISSDIKNLNEIGSSIKNYINFLKEKDIDFFIKWIILLVCITIYIICLVLFLKVNQSDKASMLHEYWYSFLFEAWYFVPVLTITFICIFLIVYYVKLDVISLVLIVVIHILFVLAIYYSYNNAISRYTPVILYGILLIILIFTTIYISKRLANKTMLLLFVPIYVMTGFGIFIGVEYAIGNWDSFINQNPLYYEIL